MRISVTYKIITLYIYNVFHLESLMLLVKKNQLTRDFGIEILLVNDVQNHSTMPIPVNYFRAS